MSLFTRRDALRGGVMSAGLALFDALVPAWARSMGVTGIAAPDSDGPLEFDLAIGAQRLDIAGRNAPAQAINNTIPGPLLEWQEGREVILNVRNDLKSDTSIHWHGIILPFEMDGVPGVTFPGIAPGTTFQYRFPVRQNGTYWYHSHSGMQEQLGVYGPLVIHPRAPQELQYDRDYVVLLSDWTFEDPSRLMAKLKKVSDYYNYQQLTLSDIFDAPAGAARKQLWQTKLDWDRMRMMVSDIADVTGSTYTYLMNGLHPAGNWTGLFVPGEKVRLRFINGSAMSIFNVRIPGAAMSVIAADGQDIEPVEADELQISTAETFDVIVQPPENRAYTIMAESIDRSGFAAGTLSPRVGMRGDIPPLRKPPRLSMVDMGMDHAGMDHGTMDHAAMGHGAMEDAAMGQGAMDHAAMGHGAMDHAAMGHGAMDHAAMGHGAMEDAAMGQDPMDHAAMGHGAMDHAAMGHGAMEDTAMGQGPMDHAAMGHGTGPTDNGMPDPHAGHSPATRLASAASGSGPGPIIARHDEGNHGPGNESVAVVQRDRLGERGTGLESVNHRVLVYTDLRRRAADFDSRPPSRELELHLTGHMERYMWSFDGVQFHEVSGPIEFHYGERLRLTLVNDTMMNHPIHLHGMWLEIENGQGDKIPRKHTINVKPASRVSMLVNADAPGRWAFHCHLLYHMEMGMFRVVRVS